jgi:iron complex transport system substrate-binding protein
VGHRAGTAAADRRNNLRNVNLVLAEVLAGVLAIALLFCSLPLVADIELPQADGSVLVLPHAAQSLITLAPNLAELVFAAGAGDHLIATVEYSDYPADAALLPRVGDAFRLDLEQILSLKPDLVIAWSSGNPPAAIEQLRSLGLATWTIEIREPDDIAAVLEQIGEATGNTGAAREAAAQTRTKLDQLRQNYAGAAPVSYFYQVAASPLYTINGQHLVSRSFELCGGTNIFRDASMLAPQITHEAVIAADPQVLLAPASAGEEDPLARWQDWPRMQAVRHGALFTLPADEISRATPRMLDAVAAGCSLLHPLRTRGDR